MPPESKRKNHGKKAVRISQMDFIPEKPLIKLRRIAILFADGFQADVIEGLRAAMILGLASAPTGLVAMRTGIGISSDHCSELRPTTISVSRSRRLRRTSVSGGTWALVRAAQVGERRGQTCGEG